MLLFLLLLAALALLGIVLTIAQVARDGYGHPSTIPTNRGLDADLGQDDRRPIWSTR